MTVLIIRSKHLVIFLQNYLNNVTRNCKIYSFFFQNKPEHATGFEIRKIYSEFENASVKNKRRTRFIKYRSSNINCHQETEVSVEYLLNYCLLKSVFLQQFHFRLPLTKKSILNIQNDDIKCAFVLLEQTFQFLENLLEELLKTTINITLENE